MRPTILLCMVRGIDHMAAALLQRADLDIVALHDTSANILDEKGIPCRRFNDFLTPDLHARALREATQRAGVVAKTLDSGALQQQYDFDDGEWPGVRAAVQTIIQRDFVEEILATDLVRRVAAETDLRLVFVPEDICRDTKTVISAARRLGVPSLHLLHGFPYGTTNAHNDVTADVIAAYSGRAKRIYEGFGASPDRVVVTGNPMWDIYASPPLPGWKEQVCGVLGLDPGRPMIEYALTGVHRFSEVSVRHPVYHVESAYAVIDAFAELARRHPDWQFLLRTHPIDEGPTQQLKQRVAEIGLQSVQIEHQVPYDAVATVDLLLCTHSNLGVEALLFGKPVINVAIDRLAAPVFREGMGPLFLDDDAVLWARTEAEIAPAIEAALLDETTRARLLALRPASIERFNHANDGRATERVCALVLDLIERTGAFVEAPTRFPGFERALAEAVPEGVEDVVVVGRAARHVAAVIAEIRPQTTARTATTMADAPASDFDALVLSDPVPWGKAGEAMLHEAFARLSDTGVLVAAFRSADDPEARASYDAGAWVPQDEHGEAWGAVDAFHWPDAELLLSRCGLEAAEHAVVDTPGPETRLGWIVRAVRRPARLSPFGAARGRATPAGARSE